MPVKIILILGLMCCSYLATGQGIDLDGLATLDIKPDVIGASNDSMISVSKKKFGGHLKLLGLKIQKKSFILGEAYVVAMASQGKFDAGYLSRRKELDHGMYHQPDRIKMGIHQIHNRTVYIKEVDLAGIRCAFITCPNKNGDLLFKASVQVVKKDSANIRRIIDELIGKLQFRTP